MNDFNTRRRWRRVLCMRKQQRRLAAALAGPSLIAMSLLAGCSGGPAGSSSAASGAAAGAGAAGAHSAGAASAGAHAAAGRAQAQPAASPTIARPGADLVYTAELAVRASGVAAAVARATAIVTAAGGYISSENDSTDPAHPDQSSATLAVKIPVAAYPATLAQLDSGRLGSRLSLRQQAQDVTQRVADVGSQVASDKAAIAQLRTLLTRAGSVSDLLTVQDQINSEESDLESMLAQQKALGGETAYATVTVTVLGPKRPVPAARKPKPASPPGLATGLSGGWRAFRLAVDWLLAVIGAVAPFAIAAAILASLGYWLRRRNAARPGAGGPPA